MPRQAPPCPHILTPHPMGCPGADTASGPPTLASGIDPYVLDRAEIRAELHLDAKQSSVLNELRRQADVGVALATTGKPVDQPAIDKIIVRLVQDQRAVLTPGQLKRLEEIHIQSWGVWAFNDPAIQKKLGLNEGQRSKIKPIVEAADDAAAGAERRAMEASLTLLTADQKRLWKSMVGEPSALGPPPRPDLDPNAPGMKRPKPLNPGPQPPVVADPIAPPAPAMNLPNFETMRFPEDFVPASTSITMLDDPLVQADLKFDERQAQESRAITARYYAPFRENAAVLQVLTPSEKRAKVRELDASQSKALKSEVERLLMPAQVARAEQILRWKAIPAALMSPGVQLRLKLDETQKRAAEALWEEYTRATFSAMQEGKARGGPAGGGRDQASRIHLEVHPPPPARAKAALGCHDRRPVRHERRPAGSRIGNDPRSGETGPCTPRPR